MFVPLLNLSLSVEVLLCESIVHRVVVMLFCFASNLKNGPSHFGQNDNIFLPPAFLWLGHLTVVLSGTNVELLRARRPRGFFAKYVFHFRMVCGSRVGAECVGTLFVSGSARQVR